jgi:hypothetical protein
MKVTVAKHGGFAAGIRRPPTVVDSDAMPRDAAEELVRLVTEAKAAAPNEMDGPGRARDALSYSITVEDDRGETAVLKHSDTAEAPALSALVEWVERQSRS